MSLLCCVCFFVVVVLLRSTSSAAHFACVLLFLLAHLIVVLWLYLLAAWNFVFVPPKSPPHLAGKVCCFLFVCYLFIFYIFSSPEAMPALSSHWVFIKAARIRCPQKMSLTGLIWLYLQAVSRNKINKSWTGYKFHFSPSFYKFPLPRVVTSVNRIRGVIFKGQTNRPTHLQMFYVCSARQIGRTAAPWRNANHNFVFRWIQRIQGLEKNLNSNLNDSGLEGSSGIWFKEC